MAVQCQNNGYPFERGDTFLNQLPAFIAAGLSYPLLAPLAFGVKIILEPVYQEKALVKDLVKYKPNIAAATKSFWFAAAKDKHLIRNVLENLKIPVSGGETISEQDRKALNGFLCEHGCLHEMYFGYGMSELTHKFFWKDSDGNTWCRTGDIGYINENGEVYVLGRAADSMRTKSGKRLYFFEVEAAVQEELAVVQCKASYLEETDELVVNLVLHTDVEKDALYSRLDGLCRRVLGEKQTVRYKEWDAFPLTQNGKSDIRAMKSIASHPASE